MQQELEKDLLNSCDQLFPEAVEFTKEMVKQYSVLGQENGVLQVVERVLQELNLPVTRVPMKRAQLKSSPLYAPVEWDHESKFNLVSCLNPGEKGKSLVFKTAIWTSSVQLPLICGQKRQMILG